MMKKLFAFAALAAALALTACGPFSEVRVDDNVPAGNIIFDHMSNDTVYVHQDYTGSMKPWFYWAFRVRGAQGKTLTFVFTEYMALCERGPLVSLDKGESYDYLAEEGTQSKQMFTYTFPARAREVWFSECRPYTPERWQRFIGSSMNCGHTGVLCKSREGRDVPFFAYSPESGTPALSVVISARHHCSEAPADYVVEGITAAFFEDSELGAWLRENVRVLVVPFMDMDGAVNGDQGKWRLPHDHNRDYTEFIYPETKALAENIKALDPDIFLDIHNPKLYAGDNFIYTPFKEYSNMPEETRFSSLVEKYQEGELNYRTTDDLPFGIGWNKPSNYSQGYSAVQWASLNCSSVKVCRTFEVPFAYANDALVDQEKLKLFGHGIVRAFRAYVED